MFQECSCMIEIHDVRRPKRALSFQQRLFIVFSATHLSRYSMPKKQVCADTVDVKKFSSSLRTVCLDTTLLLTFTSDTLTRLLKHFSASSSLPSDIPKIRLGGQTGPTDFLNHTVVDIDELIYFVKQEQCYRC